MLGFESIVTGRSLLTAVGLVYLVWTVTGCSSIIEDDYGCRGYPEVNNAIPDIALVSNAERYVRDLEVRPSVFYHSGNETMTYDVVSSNDRIAEAWVSYDGMLNVVGHRPGQAIVEIEAYDYCDNYVRTTFLVNVQTRKASQ